MLWGMNSEALFLQSLTADEVATLAHRLSRILEGGSIVSLEGELGSGKTFFVRQLVTAWGSPHKVTSPTFVLQKIYELPVPVRGIRAITHYDLYRLESYDELAALGFEEIPPDTIACVEWGDRFVSFFPPDTLRIQFSIVDDMHRDVKILAPRTNMLELLYAELEKEGLLARKRSV